ncbi:hydrogenase-3 nickel incorporation protein HypA [Breoghania corrubedonensis]|uniref:Hydrogenase maturation factor HypA n=1 Tax=Breoghania corrubedonensis TaxID=665038 RepID=A0A2T5VGF3_9HYPH|nr:hydrogenase maturation nickel metallochaperone HypA [Breoghania corrubedonensis]PTW62843.1 hydrogenase-3 nickel incorporation protein HypA [Breoghania corrubedonensis]
MHEFSVMDSLMKLLVEHADASGITRVTRVRLVVGRLRGLDLRQLRGCFEILVEDTLAKDAVLDIESVPPAGHCRTCGADFAIPDYTLHCPHCGGGEVDITKGRELHMASFDGIRETAADA